MFFKRVRNSVYAFSNGKQTSWEHTSLTGAFIFNSGQLIHSIDTPYSSNVISDKDVNLDFNETLDQIILDLKSYNWYVQNPAINKISQLDPSKCDKNKLFLLGRNILQSAVGNSGNAMDFMEHLDLNLKPFNIEGQNHILNGILFEIYFDSDGKYRNENIKGQYLDFIVNLAKTKGYENSFEFIKNQLIKVGSSLFYIPSVNNSTFSFDITMDRNPSRSEIEDEYFVKSIKFEGDEVLNPNEKNPYFGDNSTIYYEPLLYKDLPNLISKLSGIPNNLIIINTNFEMTENSKLKFPLGHLIIRN